MLVTRPFVGRKIYTVDNALKHRGNMARLRCRCLHTMSAIPRAATTGAVGVGPLMVDALCSEACFGNYPLALTWAQRRILFVLLVRRGRLVDRATLYHEAFGRILTPGSRAVDVHIGRIRRALQATCPDAVVTVDRVGYRIDPRVLEDSSARHVSNGPS
jgi:DNA-binding response OmpR family regulator